jgi:CubicO group peptidase (beta-lactamase class C family)
MNNEKLIMKEILLSITLFTLLVLTSCGVAETTNYKVEVPKVDSTKYYDSLFKEARYSIDTFFKKRLEIQEFNGNVLFAYKGHVILEKSYGFTNPDDSIPLTKDHRFQIASITKTFTSTAILQLMENGKLKLEDSVNIFIDSFPYRGITVEMLLCHRGGLSKYEYYCDDFWTNKKIPIKNQDVIKIMKAHCPKPYNLPVGTFEYINTGYMLLSLIIEKAFGMTYSDYLQKKIFEPAEMKNTTVYEPGKTILNQLYGFNGKGNFIEDSYLNGATGDKGIYTTAEDLLKFDRALRNKKLLSAKTQELAYTPTSIEREEKGKDNYGFGWRLKNSHNGYQIVYHTGWWKGFRGNFIRNMTKDITIITLDNIKRGPFLSLEMLMDLTEGIVEEKPKGKRQKP